MLAALLSLAVGAELVLAVSELEVTGTAPAELAPAIRGLLEDDLAQAGAPVRTDAELRAATGAAKARGAAVLVTGTFAASGTSARLDLKIIDVASQRVLGVGSTVFSDSDWGASRGKLVRAVCSAAKLSCPRELPSPAYPADAVLAWGRALRVGTPEAFAEVAKKWPSFGPAQRRVK